MGDFRRRKVVVVGDQSVGKTSLLNVLHSGKYSRDTEPPEGYFRIFEYDETKYQVYFYDTAGHLEYERLRALSYKDTHLLLIIFDIANRTSFDAVRTRWIPEVKQNCPKAPYMIIGTKVDLRSDAELQVKTIAFEEADLLARETSQFRYLEISAKDNIGLTELLNAIKDEIVTTEDVDHNDNKKRCTVM